MPARVSEAYVLRSYPFQEGDLIVSFLTRDQGRLRGVAKRARRPKSAYGSGLERLSQVRMTFYQRENAELVRLDACELIQSQFGLASSYEAGVALDYIAEVSDHLLPPAEPNERYFRLLGAVLADLRSSGVDGVWRAVTYFSYWAVRLSGILPDLRISADSQSLVQDIATRPITELHSFDWPKPLASDLRRVLARNIEEHIERRLVTVPLMEAL